MVKDDRRVTEITEQVTTYMVEGHPGTVRRALQLPDVVGKVLVNSR